MPVGFPVCSWSRKDLVQDLVQNGRAMVVRSGLGGGEYCLGGWGGGA